MFRRLPNGVNDKRLHIGQQDGGAVGQVAEHWLGWVPVGFEVLGKLELHLPH